MMDPMAERKELRRQEAENLQELPEEKADGIPRTFRAIEDRKYPMSRKERRRLAREARKNGAKDVPFKELWDEMVSEGAYVEA